MAKKTTATGLLAEVATLPDSTGHRGNKSWVEKLSAIDAPLMDEIGVVVNRYHSGDPAVVRKFSNETELAKWLRGHVARAGITITDQPIRGYIRGRRPAHG